MRSLNTRIPLIVASCVLATVVAGRPAVAQVAQPPAAVVDLAGDPIPAPGVLRFGTTRFRTVAAATDVFFAGPATLVTFCPDRFFVIDEWPAGTRRFLTRGTDEPIRAVVSLAASGRLVISAASGALSIVDTATGKRLAQLDPTPYVTTALAVSVDGMELACGGEDGRVHVRALSDGKEIRVMGKDTQAIVCVAYATPARIVSLHRGGKMQVWDGGAEKPSVEFETGAGSSRFLISPDAGKAWVAGGTGAISCWSLADGSRLLSIESDVEETRCIALSPDGSVVVTGGRGGRVRAWNAASGKEAWSTQSEGGWVNGVSFSPDGKAVVSVREDRQVLVLDATTGADLSAVKGHSSDVSCLALSPDGRILATGAWDHSVRLWNAETSRQIACFNDLGGPVNALAWAPSGASVAVAAGKEVLILEAKGDAKRRSLGSVACTLRSLAWCGDAGVLAGGTDTLIRLWSTRDGNPPREFAGHATMVAALASSPDGMRFASASPDGRSAIWDLAAGKPSWLDNHPQAVTSMAFSADGRRVATGCQDACIRLWETETGKAAGIIRGFDGMVTGVSFSPDGTLIAGSAVGNSVRVCEAPGGREIAVFHGLGGTVNGVCWTRDGKRVITAMHDTTAIAWQVRK